jgi:hypothetical protein
MSREFPSQFSNNPIQTVKEAANSGLHKAATVIHDGIDSTAAYLKDHDIADMGNDAMKVCRKYPAQAILSSLAIGFLVGRVLRR